VRHVVVDQALAVEVEVAGGAEVGRGGEGVVRAEERDLSVVVLPPDDARAVDVRGPRRRPPPGRALGVREREGAGEREQQQNEDRAQVRTPGSA
jgi:hypothetical protein